MIEDENYLPEPYSKEAEQGLLGAMLIKPELIDVLSSEVKASDFFFAYNREIFEGIMSLHVRNAAVDMLTVSDEVGRLSNGDSSLSYAAELYKNTPSAANAKSYASIVVNRSIDRSLARAGSNIHEIAYGTASTEDKISQAHAEIMGISTGHGDVETISANDAIQQHVAELDRRVSLNGAIDGLETGIKDLDEKIMGLKPESLYIVAGRPKMGKTTLAMNIADNVAVRAHKQVLVFSLEMSHKQLMDKSLASLGSIPLNLLKSGVALKSHPTQLLEASNQIANSGLTLYDRKSATINRIRSVARRHKMLKGLDLIVVDHLGLVGVEDPRASPVQRVSEITRELKLLARELDCPIIALSQLNRALEQRPNKRPIPSDLRDSGTIEQDADMIIFVYRDEVYNEHTESKGIAEIIIGVARDVEACTVRTRYQGNYSLFSNLDSAYKPPQEKPERSYSSSSLLD